MKWLILKLLRMATRVAALRLALHVKGCDNRRCKNVDIENCDETSFCMVGNALFVDVFDMGEIIGRYER